MPKRRRTINVVVDTGLRISDFNPDKPARNVGYLGSKKHPVARNIRLPQTSDAKLDAQAERAELEFQERKNSDKSMRPRTSKHGSHWATKKLKK